MSWCVVDEPSALWGDYGGLERRCRSTVGRSAPPWIGGRNAASIGQSAGHGDRPLSAATQVNDLQWWCSSIFSSRLAVASAASKSLAPSDRWTANSTTYERARLSTSAIPAWLLLSPCEPAWTRSVSQVRVSAVSAIRSALPAGSRVDTCFTCCIFCCRSGGGSGCLQVGLTRSRSPVCPQPQVQPPPSFRG